MAVPRCTSTVEQTRATVQDAPGPAAIPEKPTCKRNLLAKTCFTHAQNGFNSHGYLG